MEQESSSHDMTPQRVVLTMWKCSRTVVQMNRNCSY